MGIDGKPKKRKADNRTVPKRLDPDDIPAFERLNIQMTTFYYEISVLSKKNPDSAMNKFKLRYVNDVISKVNDLLGEDYRPFNGFTVFCEEEMPTTSDVTIMLKQYLAAMERFKKAYTYFDDDNTFRWKTTGHRVIEVDDDF